MRRVYDGIKKVFQNEIDQIISIKNITKENIDIFKKAFVLANTTLSKDQRRQLYQEVFMGRSRKDIGKKLLINLLNLKKNKEFEFRYEPFYTRVNHMVCPNTFLNSITDNFNFKEIEDYGTIDPIYNNIIPHLDFTQIRALNYASKTLPDMFNLRLDKAFMRHSIEARLPFQSINLAEFFIAMKSNYRFKNNLGKFFLRNFVEKKVDKNIAKNPKRGMGSSLWDVSKNNKLLNAKEEILSTNFFDNYPFNKNIKKILLNNNVHPGNIWAATTLIKTFENYKYYKNLN